MAYKTGQTAKIAGVSPTTVRLWSADYADFLSPLATPGKGKTRAYTDQDIAILATVKELKSQQLDDEAITAALADGEWIDWHPDDGQDDGQRQEDTVEEGQRVMILTATVAKFEGELTAVTDERNRLLTELDQVRNDHLAAEIRAVAAETELKVLRDVIDRQKPAEGETEERRSFWRRLLGR